MVTESENVAAELGLNHILNEALSSGFILIGKVIPVLSKWNLSVSVSIE